MHVSGQFVTFTVLAAAAGAAAKGVWTTPHDSYSSSVGVLGCKINTNRVAYWPGSVDCNNICVKLSYKGRSVHLLRIDQSGGAYDISYDAWNYLQTGKSASADPITGGTVAMDYEEVDASECADLIHTDGHKLPLSASNSMNFLTSCLGQPGSWVAKNHVLYNICDAICSLGHDEECKLDLAVSNQPSCPHTLGLTSPLTTAPVYNIQYDSGTTVVAGTGEVASPNGTGEDDGDEDGNTGDNATDPAATGGVFVEVGSSQSYAAESPTQAPTAYPTAGPSSTDAAQETSSPASVGSVTTTSLVASYSEVVPSQSSGTGRPSVGTLSTGAYTTLSKATISGGQGTTASGSPSSSPTAIVSAGNAGVKVSALALVSSIVVCSLLGAF